MAEITLGNQYNFLRHVITLESIGIVPVLVGRGVVVGIGTSTRGPAMKLYGIAGSSPSLIRRIYFDGPLKEGLETAAALGLSGSAAGLLLAACEQAARTSPAPGVPTGPGSTTLPPERFDMVFKLPGTLT